MRKLPILLLVLICLGVLYGCQRDYDPRLIRAESLMADHSDSAYAIIESIDSSKLSRKDFALYALLKIEGQEKLYMDPRNDSLIQVAVDYYADRDEYERAAKAYYYQGRVKCYRDTPAAGIVSFFHSREIAEKHDLYFWAGQACRGISDVAWGFNNAPEALKYAEKQLEYFRLSGCQPFLNFGISEYALSLNNARRNDEAIMYAHEALDSANMVGDNHLRVAALEVLGYAYLDKDEYEMAKEYLYPLYQSGVGTTDDSIYYGIAMYNSGKYEEGSEILRSVENPGTLKKNIFLAWDYARRGDYKKAFEEICYTDSLVTKIVKKSVDNTITSNLDSYFRLNQEMTQLELEDARLKIWLIIAIGFIIVCGVVAIGFRHHKKQQDEIERKVGIAEELQYALERAQYNQEVAQSEFEDARDNIVSLKSAYDIMQSDFEKMRLDYERIQAENERIQSVTNVDGKNDEALVDFEKDNSPLHKEEVTQEQFHKRFEILETLTEMVSQNRNKKDGRQRIAEYVTTFISDFSEDSDRYNEMVKTIDGLFGNLMTDFKQTYPNRKPEDYKLFLFSVMGLSNVTIAEFLQEERVESVYTRRRRLKNYIKQSAPEDRDRFLPFL